MFSEYVGQVFVDALDVGTFYVKQVFVDALDVGTFFLCSSCWMLLSWLLRLCMRASSGWDYELGMLRVDEISESMAHT
jgi:hypothetical protein